MKLWKKCAAMAMAATMAVTMWGCNIPLPGFADYDVSAYFQAYLDSSYHASYTEYMTITGETQTAAEAINATTVENAAINFCNTYGISPSDEQLTQLQEIMRQTFARAQYIVKEEERVETGYYIEVEITPIVNFAGRSDDISRLRQEAEDEANAAMSSQEEDDSYDDGYNDVTYDEYGNEVYDDTSSEDTSSDTEEIVIDANELFVDKVVEFCQREVANISFDSESRTIALDIIQTEDGELQLNTNQLDTIDKTVVSLQG